MGEEGSLHKYMSSPPKKAPAPSKKRAAASTAEDKPAKAAKRSTTSTQRSAGIANAKGDLGKKATAAELEDEGETPFQALLRVMTEGGKKFKEAKKAEGNTVVYWCRMKDLRVEDNRALSMASAKARELNKHLVVLHVLSPGDYRAHDRADKRIDFVLRNLRDMQADFDTLNIPMHVPTMEPRKSIPGKVIDWLGEIGATHLFGNIEYEVDELRRDIEVYEKASDRGVEVVLVQDICIVQPGKVLTKQGKPYSVFSPWFKNWASIVTGALGEHIDAYDRPQANDASARQDSNIKAFFDDKIPEYVEGYKLEPELAKRMLEIWPSGSKSALEFLRRFTATKHMETYEGYKPAARATDDVEAGSSKSKVRNYGTQRNRPDIDGTSRLSPYLAAGVLSARHCLREMVKLNKGKLNVERAMDMGMWTQEVSWRDFYQHVLATWPRVCMGKAFQLKFDDVAWEYNDEHQKAWEEGRTGVPFIDAAMRQANHEGYMHNRARMAVAMYQCKDLMLDWRLGERYFMRSLIDGDLGSNNGGWQWSASTGTDPQPYFRVFNPTLQSEKSDPNGDYIRHWLPELRSVKGKAIHAPHERLSAAEFKKLGYLQPLVDHAKARKRAIARYKEPGSRAEE